MIEIKVIIPKADNNGQPFTEGHHEAFEGFILSLFGGITRLGEVEGSWLDGGVTYHDASRLYLIALDSITQGGDLKRVVEFAKMHYQQEAIFIRYLGLAEVL